nr:hypothetical protein [Neobacillus drentensis]
MVNVLNVKVAKWPATNTTILVVYIAELLSHMKQIRMKEPFICPSPAITAKILFVSWFVLRTIFRSGKTESLFIIHLIVNLVKDVSKPVRFMLLN